MSLSYAHAQIEAEVAVFPRNPEPNQEVTLTLGSYTFDVNLATITWKNGATTLLSGLGAKQLKVLSGSVGQQTTITYLAETSAGEAVTGSITISPQFVDLIYEATESYVPPFYEGRSLPSEGSKVRVNALPTISDSGKVVPVSNLSFSWYINGEFYRTAAGTAGVVSSIPLDYLSTATDIKVMVRSPLGNVAEKTVSVYPVMPLPTLYAYDDVLGSLDMRAFTGRIELARDITLIVEPYFLSARGALGKTVKYSWYMDGLPVTPQDENLLTLRPKENSYGAKTLTIIVENTKRILQKAEVVAEIVFDTRS